MTDRILSEEGVDSLELFAMRWNSNPRELARPCMKLIASHRLRWKWPCHVTRALSGHGNLMTESELRANCMDFVKEVGPNWSVVTLRVVAERIFDNLKFLLKA